MKPLDDRVHRLLDGELSERDEADLRAELGRDPDLARQLANLEGPFDALRARRFPLPEDFERRAMARLARQPEPRRGLLPSLAEALAPGWRLGFSLAALLAVAAAAFGGYRVGVERGRASTPAVAAAPAVAPAEPKVLVRFALAAPDAQRVEVAGTFNGWGARGVALAPAGNGLWAASLEVTRGRHEYTFVVDGQRWVPDPAAAQLVDDGFGGHNAVLEL